MKHNFALPSETTEILADRVLLLAPHADDDVLGCGGLLAQLAAYGAAIRVIFLSDSSGGEEQPEEQEAYADRRHQEALRSLAVLGVEDIEYLDFPDGELHQYISLAAGAIEGQLLDFRPDLVLAVSPLEKTTDHQAAFAALHRALTPLRGDGDLDHAVAGLRVLLYEINHPAYPNILVDVSNEITTLTEAIKEHTSQLELHNYLKAAIGIRRYRTLSLPPSVGAAEGYRQLSVADFVTHSVSGLIRSVGGLPEVHEVHEGPLISVIVRTKDRPEMLREALESIAVGAYRNVEVVLVNDGGEKPETPADFPFPIERIEIADNQGRAAAANAGIAAASGEYVSFLDDDDLAEPAHLATLAGLVKAEDVRVVYTDAAVGIYEMDPDQGWLQVERRLPYSRDFDPDLLLFDNYIPFNTLLIKKSLLDEVGPFDVELPFFEDWDLLIRLAWAAPFHHLRQVTCEYRHYRGGGLHILGERPAEQRADFLKMKAAVIERYSDRHTPELIAQVVARLRDEAVAKAEECARGALDIDALRDAHRSLQDAFHRLNGEKESIRIERDSVVAERDRLVTELERYRSQVAEFDTRTQQLFSEHAPLRDTIEDQADHLRRTYDEIERLNELINEMMGTKAWRVHRVMDKIRGRG
jgi:LmbE family N-acetylglucosaminyl deacetylase/glycosyltransferase involved in cell wall biosynthesis